MVKLAYIGGGSLFVTSILNGVAQIMRFGAQRYPVEISLYDVLAEKAQPMAAYGDILRSAWGVPMEVSVASSRAEALEGADVVIVSVWLRE